MNKSLLLLALALSPAAAFADGFRCETPADSLDVKIYNETNPRIGTRVPAVVVISDSRRQLGNRTIAKFEGESGLIESVGAHYDINVDGRFSGVQRGGEDIAGTKLKYLRKVLISVQFSYDRPLEDGARVAGHMTLVKTDGSRIQRTLDCTRYLRQR